MVKLIAGLRGSGKTKHMLDALNEAIDRETGSLVCIELGNDMRYDVNYKVRLIEYQDYQLVGVDALKAFISGLHAGNFDITHIFLKSVHRLLDTDDCAVLQDFCDWCSSFGEKNGLNFTMTARLDPRDAPAALQAYMI